MGTLPTEQNARDFLDSLLQTPEQLASMGTRDV